MDTGKLPPYRPVSNVYGKERRREVRSCYREDEPFPEITIPVRRGVLDRADMRNAAREERIVSLKGDAFAKPRRVIMPVVELPTDYGFLGGLLYDEQQHKHRSGDGGWTRAELEAETKRLAAMSL